MARFSKQQKTNNDSVNLNSDSVISGAALGSVVSETTFLNDSFATKNTKNSKNKIKAKYDPQKLAQSLSNADNIAYLKSLDNDTFALRFLHGSLQENEATFIKSEEGDEFVMLPKDAITHILSILQDTREESLKVMLRYAIRDLMPFDLEDAMAVAMHELESQRLDNGNLPFIDMKILAKKVRLKHPNLFFNG